MQWRRPPPIPPSLPAARKVRNLDGICSNVRRPEARGRELTRALWYWTE
jgi:hypothetical protein